MHAEEYHRPDYNELLSTIYGLLSKYDVDKVYLFYQNTKAADKRSRLW